MDEQEMMIKFQMFEQQINQLQQQMQAVEQGIIEMNNLTSALDELVGSVGKEVLAPIGRGVFAKTKLLSEDLNVDIGSGNFVKKSIPETKEIIDGQIKKLGEVKGDLDGKMEEINSELTKVFIEAQQKQKEKNKGCSNDNCECSEPCDECECEKD